MKGLKAFWQWLNASQAFPTVDLTPPAEDGALRIEALQTAVTVHDVYISVPDGSIQHLRFAVDAEGKRTIIDKHVYAVENCPIAIVKTADGWKPIHK